MVESFLVVSVLELELLLFEVDFLSLEHANKLKVITNNKITADRYFFMYSFLFSGLL